MSQAVQREDVERHRQPISHTIYGSTAESMDQLEDESVHLIVTSPPYWDIKDYGPDEQIGHNESLNEYLDRLNSVWKECYRVLKPGCRMVVNIGDQYHRSTEGVPYHITPLNSKIVNNIMETTRHNLLFLGNIIWQKVTNTETSGGACVMGSFGRPRNGYVSYDYEYVSIFKKPGDTPDVPSEIKDGDAIPTEEWKELFDGHWQFPGARQTEHPAPFPDELPRRVMRMFTFSGDTVLDPFLGQGTTIRVADQLNRSSIGFETGFESPSGKPWRQVIRENVGADENSSSFTFDW